MKDNFNYPKESKSQELGRLAAEAFVGVKPSTWLVKEIDGDLDFGIDYFIQLKDAGCVKYNFLAQIKGTKDSEKIKEDSIKVDLKASTLNYYANQGLVIIIVCDLIRKEFYYEYLHNILYNLNGNKRYLSEPPKTYRVSISKRNKLNKNLDIKGVVEEHAHGIYRITRASSIEQRASIKVDNEELGYEFEPTRDVNGNGYLNKQGHVSVEAILPNDENWEISCIVWFNLPRVTGACISLNEKQILNQLFTGYRSKADDSARKWFFSEIDSGFCIDIGAVRLTVPKQVIYDFSNILDDLMDVYVERMLHLENTICSHRFPIAKSITGGYKMIKVMRGLWNAILSFARDHEIGSGNGDWNIFGCDQYSLRVHIKDKPFNWAGNIVISPESDSFFSDFRKDDDEVVLIWNCMQENGSLQYIESVENVHSWLINQLIPAVVSWVFELNVKREIDNSWWGKKLLKKLRLLSLQHQKPVGSIESYVLRDYKDKSLNFSKVENFEQLCQNVDDLQHFFHLNQNLYLETGGLITLYLGLIDIISEVGQFGTNYIAGNLGVYFDLSKSNSTKEELTNFLNGKIKALESGTTNSFRLDTILRCYQFLLRSYDSLSLDQVDKISSYLISANSLKNFLSVIEKRRAT